MPTISGNVLLNIPRNIYHYITMQIAQVANGQDPVHNVHIVQYLLLSTEQAGTYLQSSFVWHHLTYINSSLFDRKQNIENSIFVSFKL